MDTDTDAKETKSASVMMEELQQRLSNFLISIDNAEKAMLTWKIRKNEIRKEHERDMYEIERFDAEVLQDDNVCDKVIYLHANQN